LPRKSTGRFKMAEEAFAAFDFESDSEWLSYFGRLDIPAGGDSEAKVTKLKRKWFKKNKDASLDVDPPRASASATSSNTSSNTSTPGPSTAPPKAAPQAAKKEEPTTLKEFFLRQETIYTALSIWLCANTVLYCLPLGMSDQAYHRVCNVAFIRYIQKFFNKHGFSFSGIISTCKGLYNKDYQAAMTAQAIVNNNHLHNAFIYFLFNSAPPIPFALFPAFLTSIYSLCEWQSALLNLLSPTLAGYVDPLLQRVIQHGKADPATGRVNILYWNAWLSMAIAAVLFVQLFTPARSFLLFIVYLQFLLIRHTAPDARHQRIVTNEIKTRTDGWFHHPKCPGIVGKGYDAVLSGIGLLTKRTAAA